MLLLLLLPPLRPSPSGYAPSSRPIYFTVERIGRRTPEFAGWSSLGPNEPTPSMNLLELSFVPSPREGSLEQFAGSHALKYRDGCLTHLLQ